MKKLNSKIILLVASFGWSEYIVEHLVWKITARAIRSDHIELVGLRKRTGDAEKTGGSPDELREFTCEKRML